MFSREKALEALAGPDETPQNIPGLISAREMEARNRMKAQLQLQQQRPERQQHRSRSEHGDRPTSYQVAVERRQRSRYGGSEHSAANMRRSKSQRRYRDEPTESLARTQSTPYTTGKKPKEEKSGGLLGLWGSIKRSLSSNYRDGTDRINEHINRTYSSHSSHHHHHRRQPSQTREKSHREKFPPISRPIGPADLCRSVEQPVIPAPPKVATSTSAEKARLQERLAQDYQRQETEPELQHVKSRTKEVHPPYKNAIKSQIAIVGDVEENRPTTAWPRKPVAVPTEGASSKSAGNVDITSKYSASNTSKHSETDTVKIPSRTVQPQHIIEQAQTQTLAPPKSRPRSQISQALNPKAGLCAICERPAPSSSMTRALCDTCTNLGWKLEDVRSQSSVPTIKVPDPATTRSTAFSNKRQVEKNKPTPPIPQGPTYSQPNSNKPSPSSTPTHSQQGKPPFIPQSSSSSTSTAKRTPPVGAPTLARAQFAPEEIHPAFRDEWVHWADDNMPQHQGEVFYPRKSALPAPLNVPASMTKRDAKALPEGGMDGIIRIAGPYAPPVLSTNKIDNKGKGKAVQGSGTSANVRAADDSFKRTPKGNSPYDPAANKSRVESVWDDVVPASDPWGDGLPPLPAVPSEENSNFSLPSLAANPFLPSSSYSSFSNPPDYPSDGRKNPIGGSKGLGISIPPPPPVPEDKKKRTSSMYSRNTMGLMQDVAGMPSSWQAWDEGEGWYDRTSILPKTPASARTKESPERRRR